MVGYVVMMVMELLMLLGELGMLLMLVLRLWLVRPTVMRVLRRWWQMMVVRFDVLIVIVFSKL